MRQGTRRKHGMFTTPDLIFLLAAFVAWVLSTYLFFTGRRELGIYVGLWVPANLLLGLYIHVLRGRGG